MGYVVTPKGTVVVEHAFSKKQATVQLTEVGPATRIRKLQLKEDSESFDTTFEGSFQIDVDAEQTIAGKVTVTVQYSSGLDGQEIDGTVDSSISLLSCEILEIPAFEIREVEDD